MDVKRNSFPLRCLLAGIFACAASFGLAGGAAAQGEHWPTHGWPRSSPEAQGISSKTLVDAFDYVREHRIPIHSLLIVRNGCIVLDAYFWPFQDGQLHDLASVTKSVTSTLAGIAIGQHKLSGVSEPVLTLYGQRPIARSSSTTTRSATSTRTDCA